MELTEALTQIREWLATTSSGGPVTIADAITDALRISPEALEQVEGTDVGEAYRLVADSRLGELWDAAAELEQNASASTRAA